MMVVIGIISILLAAMAPIVTSLAKSNNLNTGGRIVANLLTAARSEAINQRRLIQLRVATKWTNSSGSEDTASSYRKFSVWRKPQPNDTLQSSDPNDPYVQVSKWETLPTGIIFERDTSSYATLPPSTDPRYPGTYFLTAALGNTKTGVRVPNGTADVAWIEFTPTGAPIFSGTAPNKVYLLVTEGVWDGASLTWTHSGHPNWLVTTVDTLVGRVSVVRP
jgi:type II secretory pathway pseudopilin PulG